MQKRLLVVALLGLGTLAIVVGGRFFFRTATVKAATTTVGPAESYLVILGVNDTTATNWDGSITVTGAAIEILRGWRFEGTDAVSGTSNWKAQTRTTPSLNPPGPVQENGLIV